MKDFRETSIATERPWCFGDAGSDVRRNVMGSRRFVWKYRTKELSVLKNHGKIIGKVESVFEDIPIVASYLVLPLDATSNKYSLRAS